MQEVQIFCLVLSSHSFIQVLMNVKYYLTQLWLRGAGRFEWYSNTVTVEGLKALMKREEKKKRRKYEDRVGHSDNRWGQNARSHNQFVQLLMCKKKKKKRNRRRGNVWSEDRLNGEEKDDLWALRRCEVDSLAPLACRRWVRGSDIRAEINVTQVQQSSD